MPKPKARRITAEEEEIAGKLNKTYERLRPDKANLEAQCQEIADRFWPSQSRLFMNQDQGMVHGEKRGEEVFDSTPCVALNKGAAILDSLLTPANSVWHQMACDVPELMNDRETQLWLEELNRAIFRKRYAPTANFVSQNQLVYKGELAYGTSALFTDEFRGRRGEKGYRYKNIHLSELLILENHQGIVDEVIRYYKASAGNIVERFPRTCPEFIRKKAEKYPEHKYYLLHWVKPREKVDYDRADHLGMEWVSCYATMEQKCFLEEGGYTSMPYAVGRYELVPGEPWARSPAMDVLAAVKTMNEMKRTILTHGQKAVAPPLFAYDDGVLDVANIRSGAFNSGGVSSDGKMLVHSMPSMMFQSRALMPRPRLQVLALRPPKVLLQSPTNARLQVLLRRPPNARLRLILLRPPKALWLKVLQSKQKSLSMKFQLKHPPTAPKSTSTKSLTRQN